MTEAAKKLEVVAVKKFYLVSPGKEASREDRRYYWMRDEGRAWANIIKGVWDPKHQADEVVEMVEAEDEGELDWSSTPLYNDGLSSGWLSRSGRFYGCPPRYHDKLAFYVLGSKVPELESSGWVRVYGMNYFTCEHRLSPEQRNWLSQKGHRVMDSL